MTQRKLTLNQVKSIVESVSFMDRKFLVAEKDGGFHLQMSYMEQDVDNPAEGVCEQKTRKWYCSGYSTESEIVETCWAMVCRSQMHVAGEHFNYKGRRVYSPHFDVNARVAMCDAEQYDCREPIEETPVRDYIDVFENSFFTRNAETELSEETVLVFTASIDHYSGDYVGRCEQFPHLTHGAKTFDEALKGIKELVQDVLAHEMAEKKVNRD